MTYDAEKKIESTSDMVVQIEKEATQNDSKPALLEKGQEQEQEQEQDRKSVV